MTPHDFGGKLVCKKCHVATLSRTNADGVIVVECPSCGSKHFYKKGPVEKKVD